jgi:hypothetical protein
MNTPSAQLSSDDRPPTPARPQIIRNLPVKTGGYVLIADGGSGLPTADNAGLYHVGGTADAPVFTFVKGESRSLDIPPNKNVGARTIRIAVYKSVELPK